MKVVTFASGSSGNCALVREGETCLLIDAGISLRRIRAALSRQGLSPDALQGVVITHEHADHISALPMLMKYCPVPVYAPRTVANRLRRTVTLIEDHLREIVPGVPFSVGNLSVTAFSTPHDTDQSVGYRMAGTGVFGFCTDTGCVTEEMLSALRRCGAVVIEANHDVDMLLSGRYPYPLKRRILSDRGHLSNDNCAKLACALAESGTRAIVLGHLSRENNTPVRAYRTVREALDRNGFSAVTLEVAPADGDLTLEIPG